MKPEQGFYRLLSPHLPGVAERIENAAGAGTPDFYCIWNGVSYFVECKVAKTKNWDLIKLLEPSQIAWYRRHYMNGGNTFFIVRYEDTISLFSTLTNVIYYCEKPFDWKSLTSTIEQELLFVDGGL